VGLAPWVALVALLWGCASGTSECDIALVGGHVIDPESGWSGQANVCVRMGRIVSVGEPVPSARQRVDVSGLVVAPGFIDLHVHGQDELSYTYRARDGVTTALELEAGTRHVEAFLAERKGSAAVHYGVSAGHMAARLYVKHGVEASLESLAAVGNEWAQAPATDEELERILASLAAGLDAGALGIGVGLAYTPGADDREVRAVFQLAADRGAPVFVHVAQQQSPHDQRPVERVLGHARAAGAALHIVHINSSSLAAIGKNLRAIDAARSDGVDVTTELYPYTASSTFIQAAVFDEGWRGKRGVDYDDLQWVATGERLDEESFRRYRAQGGTVILHLMKPEWIRLAMVHPGVMIASDGLPMEPGAHPRGAGTHARVLGRYVRDESVIALEDAIARMTILPARRLEGFAPVMKRKGRLQPGADADITVFDPERVRDHATFEDSLRFSRGIPHVLVGGEFVVRDDRWVGARPGVGLRSP
jgi:N-acyl-D-aspartate/D-glutamate deacylase